MISIPCSRCGRIWPEDPKHPGYPDVHHCDAPKLPVGSHTVTMINFEVTPAGSISIFEVEGGSHDGQLIIVRN